MPDAATNARFPKPLEDHPRISADDLRKVGLFEDREKEYALTCRVGKAPFTFKYCATSKHLDIQPAKPDAVQLDSYGIVFGELRYGKRPYFVELESGRHFLHLYLVGGRLISRFESGKPYGSSRGKRCRERTATKRRVDGLLGTDASAPAAGARRQQLIDELLRRGMLKELPEDAQEVIADRQQRRPRRATNVAAERTHFRAGDMRTSAAAARQRSAEYISPSSVFAILDYAVSQSECIRAGDPRFQVLDQSVAFEDEFGRLDARELVQLWADGNRWCRALQFPGYGEDGVCWFMHAALYTRGGARVWVQKRVGDNIGKAAGPVQIIRLIQTQRPRSLVFGMPGAS